MGRTLRAQVAIALLLCLLASGVSAQSDVIGVIKSVSGDATLLRNDEAVPAVTGENVYRADQLRTGPDGSLGVTLNDGSLVSLGPNTLFELSAFEFEPRRGAFEFLGAILRGTLVYSTGRIGKIAPESTRIETPTSIVAIRGTRFAIRVPADGAN